MEPAKNTTFDKTEKTTSHRINVSAHPSVTIMAKIHELKFEPMDHLYSPILVDFSYSKMKIEFEGQKCLSNDGEITVKSQQKMEYRRKKFLRRDYVFRVKTKWRKCPFFILGS